MASRGPDQKMYSPTGSSSNNVGALIFHSSGIKYWGQNEEVLINGVSLRCNFIVSDMTSSKKSKKSQAVTGS